jgi:hypothetical protein
VNAPKPAILWGRFGGLSKSEILSQFKREVFSISYTPSAIDDDGLTEAGDMSIVQLLSRAWDIPEVQLKHLEEFDGVPTLNFRNSSFYLPARCLYEMHYKRHFVRFGWMPATNASLDSFNINSELVSRFITRVGPSFILFEAPPHNAFDTLLYFVARSHGIPCFVARDNGYLGGFRLFSNPLDNWPHDTFDSLIIAPSFLNPDVGNASAMENDISVHTALLHSQLHKVFFPPKTTFLKRFLSWVYVRLVNFTQKRKIVSSGKSTRQGLNTNPIWEDLAAVFENRSNFQYDFNPTNYEVRKAIQSLNRHIPYSRNILEGGSIELDEKYIYFSFSFQPEQTTSLLGLQYEDHYQFLIDLLRVIPKDIRIICRDYPLHNWPNSLPRNIEKWNSAVRNSRIYFAPQNLSSKELIEKSLGVALVNGSSGYEALLNLKPVIYGGSPDYAKLPGTVHIGQLIQSGRSAFDVWLRETQDQLYVFRHSPHSILAEVTRNSFGGWVALTETLDDIASQKNKTLIANFLHWLDGYADQEH